MSDPPIPDIDFRNKMAWVWTTLKIFDLKFLLENLLYYNARIFNDFYFSTFNPLWKLQFVIQFKKCWFSL